MSDRVRVGIVDSGINPRDPQVGAVEAGIGIRVRDGVVSVDDDWRDALGHGTAVAATIRGLAPDATLLSIRVFHRSLSAHADALLHAIEWASRERVDLLNMSLGCASAERASEFESVCARAVNAGVTVVSAAGRLPGSLGGVIAVEADSELAEDDLRLEGDVFYAAPWARARGQLPKERNFHGTSFAVARVSGHAAAVLARLPSRNGLAVRDELSSLSLRRA